MVCTSEIPCLSSGLAKNNKIMSMFVLISWLFGYFESLAFFSKSGGNKAVLVKQDVSSQFFKGTTIKKQFFLNSTAILTKK